MNLGGALIKTVFGDTNLKDVQGLDACLHMGPSILDHRTLAKSGPLPLSFLRGCGLSDEYIKYLRSNQATEFYSCFISYSVKDQAFTKRLHDNLQNKGVRCWFAPHNLRVHHCNIILSKVARSFTSKFTKRSGCLVYRQPAGHPSAD
jgi:hypothetical protein